MLDVQVFNQRDARWANEKHGTSNSTIGKTGCTICVVASMLVHAGYKTDPSKLNKLLTDNKGYAQGNLIIWTVIPKLFPKVKWVYRHYSYNNDLASEWIKEKGIIPIIEVGAAPIGGAPGGKHWVGFVGNMKSIDPWTGTVRDTTTWQPTGMALYDYSPADQDPGDGGCLLPNTQENRDKYENLVANSSKADDVARYLGLVKELDGAEKVNSDTIIKSIAARTGNVDALKSDLAAANSEVDNRIQQVGRLEEDLRVSRQLYKDLLINENSAQTKYEENTRLLLAQLEQSNSKADGLAKQLGPVNNELAETKTKLDTCQRGNYVPVSAIQQVFDWLKNIWKQ